MPNPGSFRGSRKEFLMGEKPAYAASVVGGYARDTLALIQRRYFKRYPVDLPHTEEPTAEYLAAVDDEAPDPDPEEPDGEKLSEAEYETVMKQITQRQEIVRFRKAQIKRWLAYQYMKDQDLSPKDSGAHNPYHAILFQLTGKECGRPRRKTAVNVWRKTQRAAIEKKVKALATASGANRNQLATLRDKVARDMFNSLTAQQRDHWKQQAEEESDLAYTTWKREMESEPSAEPADRQSAIQGLVRVAQPILDTLCKATGWHGTIMMGGPEPAHSGRLNIISIHSGTTTGDVKMNFGRAERTRYKKYFVPVFGSFLQKSFSPDECRSRALRPEEGFAPMEEEDLEIEGANIDSFDPSYASPAVISQHEDQPSLEPSPAASHEPSPSPTPSTAPSPAPSLGPSQPPSPGPSPAPSRGPSPLPDDRDSSQNASQRNESSGPLHTGRKPRAKPTSTSMDVPPVGGESARASGRGNKKARGRKRGAEASVGALEQTASNQDVVPPAAKRTRLRAGVAVPAAQSSASTASPLTIETPPDAPKWFEDALLMLRGQDLGGPWVRLLKCWTEFESSENFEEVAVLKSSDRPACIKAWIQRKRSTTWKPNIANVCEFEEGFMRWWTSLQPTWRISDEGELVFEAVDGDWDAMRRPGLNGLLSVVASLFFWGVAVVQHNKGHVDWLVAVEDVRLVCECLTTSVA